MVKIFDCRKREILETKRVGGDYELRFIDAQTNQTLHVSWFQLKKPSNKSSREVELLFDSIKKHLERQEDE